VVRGMRAADAGYPLGKQLPDPTFHSTGLYCNVSQSGPEMLALMADIALLHWYAKASGLDFVSAELTRSSHRW